MTSNHSFIGAVAALVAVVSLGAAGCSSSGEPEVATSSPVTATSMATSARDTASATTPSAPNSALTQVSIYYPSVFGTKVPRNNAFCPQAVLMTFDGTKPAVITRPATGTATLTDTMTGRTMSAPMTTQPIDGCVNSGIGAPTAKFDLTGVSFGTTIVRFEFGTPTISYAAVFQTVDPLA